MITLDEKDIVEKPTEISMEEDVQNKMNSLRDALSTGELPPDLKDFVLSLQQPQTDAFDEVDDESEAIGDDEEVSYDVEVNEAAADPDEDILDGSNVSVDDLNAIF